MGGRRQPAAIIEGQVINPTAKRSLEKVSGPQQRCVSPFLALDNASWPGFLWPNQRGSREAGTFLNHTVDQLSRLSRVKMETHYHAPHYQAPRRSAYNH